MPLEFRCPGCSKLLRTPDESAGKKAKCPQCGTIVDVPVSPTGSLPSDPLLPSPASPFDQDSVRDWGNPPRSAPPDPLNPYASPSAIAPFAEAKPSSGPLSHRRVSIDDVLNRAWSVFQLQLGQCALFGLVFMAITFGISMGMGVLRMAAEAMNEPAVTIAAVVVQQIISFLVNTFFQIGLTIFSLRLARTGEARLNDLFGGGPYYLRGLLATFLFQLVLVGIVLLCLAPGLVCIATREPAIYITALVIGGVVAVVLAVLVSLRFYLLMVFIVDQDAAVGEAFRGSADYMAGNKLAAFLGGLVVSVVGGVAVMCTCGIASIVVAPFAGLFLATLYLLATGQSLYSTTPVKPEAGFRPV